MGHNTGVGVGGFGNTKSSADGGGRRSREQEGPETGFNVVDRQTTSFSCAELRAQNRPVARAQDGHRTVVHRSP